MSVGGQGAIRLMGALLLILLGAPQAAARDTSVEVGDDYFSKPVLRISPGDPVRWRSIGLLRHTVTSDEGSFLSPDLHRGESFRTRFAKAGMYRYYCRYHGAPGGRGMSGVLLVGDQPPPDVPAEPLPRAEGPATLTVPSTFPTIQAAVDAALPFDKVVVSPGIYEEAVVVATPRIVIRGTDRQGVILEGGHKRANGFLVAADGVAIENMTARNYLVNGFYWSKVKGYRGSYLSAIRNGDYGLYSIESRYGLFDNAYAAGSPDGGIYIGGCQPCDAVVTDSLAEYNELGFSGTNAGGNLWVINSEWRNNHSGVVPNTLDSERHAPQRGVVVRGNWVHGDGGTKAPFKRTHLGALGIGIALIGTEDDVVMDNLVEDSRRYGIAIIPSLDLSLWTSARNKVVNNLVSGSGIADLAMSAPGRGGNCFEANRHHSSRPPWIDRLLRCGSLLSQIGGGDLAVGIERVALVAGSLNEDTVIPHYEDAPSPGAADMKDSPSSTASAAFAPASPPQVPTLKTAASWTSQRKEVKMDPLSQSPTALMVLFGIYAYLLPVAMYSTWMAISVWDLARRDDQSGAAKVTWGLMVIAVPFAGPIAYLLAGKSQVPAGLRVGLVLGGAAVYVLLAAGSFLAMA